MMLHSDKSEAWFNVVKSLCKNCWYCHERYNIAQFRTEVWCKYPKERHEITYELMLGYVTECKNYNPVIKDRIND